MKRLLFMLLFISSFAFGQQYNFEASGFSVATKSSKGSWNAWSKLTPAKIIIKLDRDKNRFIIYSEVIQIYNIYKYEDKKEEKLQNSNSYFCVDNEGVECLVTIISPKDGSANKQIYISDDDRMILYEVVYKGEK
jgi:hypothetical protein